MLPIIDLALTPQPRVVGDKLEVINYRGDGYANLSLSFQNNTSMCGFDV